MRVGDSRNKVNFVKLHTGGQYDETQNDNSIGIGRSCGRGKEDKEGSEHMGHKKGREHTGHKEDREHMGHKEGREHLLRCLRDLRGLHGVYGWHFDAAGALRGGADAAADRVAADGDEYVRALRAEHVHGPRMGTRH